MESSDAIDQRNLPGISEGYDQSKELDGNLLNESLEYTECFALDDPQFPAVEWDQNIPYETNFYSAPLNWETPHAMASEIKQEIQPSAYTTMTTLTAAQQEKLRNIAMPPHLKYRAQCSPKSTLSYKSNSTSSPESNNISRKRKSSANCEDEEEEEEDSSSGHHAPKKTSHNMIEKRYRTNLNDKIAALRDSVPSLRIMTKSARGEDTAEDRKELQGLTPAHKLNKATVLSKATEYIAHLEKRNKRLQEENDKQKARLDAFIELFNSGSMGMISTPRYHQPFQTPPDYRTPGQSPAVEGMIRVPEDMRRLHGQLNQQPYQVPQKQVQQPQQRRGPHGWQNGGGGYLNKFMIGSLAGLMMLEGLNEFDQDAETPNARGLFAIPFQAIKGLSGMAHSSLDFSVAGYHVPATYTLHYLKTFFIVGALICAFLPSLLASKLTPPNGKKQSASIAAAPSLASPIQVRRQAWLTAIQTVWVPRHNFFLEAAALCLKTVKLSIRNTIGIQGYALLTGITEKQELARIKAWEIALDAQLAGGDIEISKSRLTLTLLASGTLPDTPARLMLKALHIRVLLWEFGNAGFNGIYIGREVAAKLARSKWNEAKNLQQLITHTRTQGDDELPECLATLLDEECDDVLVDSICQRAYNLAWNLPTTHNMVDTADGMDAVVDDFAIRSPLDAVAAWWSCLMVQRALTRRLESKILDVATQASIANYLTLGIKAAPIGSSAQIRALVARAVLVKEKRGANIAAAWKALGPPLEPQYSSSAASTLINSSISDASLSDIRMALRCATAIAHIERFPAPANPELAHHIINTSPSVIPTLLAFTAQFQLAQKMNGHKRIAESCDRALEKLAGTLRIWIGGKEGERSGLEKEVKRDLVDRCLGITRRIVGIGERDAGYESMEEEEDRPRC